MERENMNSQLFEFFEQLRLKDNSAILNYSEIPNDPILTPMICRAIPKIGEMVGKAFCDGNNLKRTD